MRNRNYQTSINLLIEAGLYQRLKMAVRLQKISMSKIVRDGTKIRLEQIEKETDVVIQGYIIKDMEEKFL